MPAGATRNNSLCLRVIMNFIPYVFPVLLCISGVYIIYWNWKAVYINKKTDRYISPVFLLGAVLLMFGFSLIPANPYKKYAWIAFLFDYTAVPYVILSAVFLVKKLLKSK
jgi:hypothetical protein